MTTVQSQAMVTAAGGGGHHHLHLHHNHDPIYYPNPHHRARGYQHSLEKKERIEEEIKQSEMNCYLMLAHTALYSIPESIFLRQDNYLSKLKRLDLSNNYVKEIPKEIVLCENLEELWLSYNPIEIFTYEIVKLSKLAILDIKHTKIDSLPSEIIDLEDLLEFDWRETPLERNLREQHKIPVNELSTLQQVFRNINIRKKTKDQLFHYLFGEHFIMDAYKDYAHKSVEVLVDELTEVFDNLDDFVAFTRRPSQFIPSTVDDIKRPHEQAKKAKHMFYEMKRDTDRKRLAADVEIKIRAIYFDRIERSEVVTLIDSIFEHVKLLEDMQFLVQYCTLLFPPEVKDANGDRIWHNILDLQDDLIQKREASVLALANGLNQLYPEQKPETLQDKAREVATFFQKERFATKKELLKMTQLTADCSKVFPPDFASIVPKDVVKGAYQQIFKNLNA